MVERTLVRVVCPTPSVQTLVPSVLAQSVHVRQATTRKEEDVFTVCIRYSIMRPVPVVYFFMLIRLSMKLKLLKYNAKIHV